MIFKNIKPIGKSPDIEIESNKKIWDLHNCADFNGYQFDQDKAILTLSWDYGCDHDNISGGNVSLICYEVKDLNISEKNPNVPRSEDNCLDHLCLISDNKILIKFRSGQSFEIECDELEFDCGTTNGHIA